MFKTALLILSGNAFTSVMLFARNLLVARMISVEDYGIAATFAISMAIVEMMSTLGLQQMIVQDKGGNDPNVQAGLQGFHLLRGLISGAVLFLLAHPIARFLGIDEIAWAYQLLALVPVLRGFIHFDIYRLQRQMRYLPSILSTSAPALLSMMSVWPLFILFKDYRVMLFAVLIQGCGLLLSSHLAAQRSYRLSLDYAIIQRAIRFGWPLLINNILLFVIFQGEKLIVGRELGMAELAIFAMGFTLTLTPTLLFTKSTQTFFLPQLSVAKEDAERFSHLSMATLQAGLLGGLALVIGTMFLGAPVVHLLLGTKYQALVPLLVWLAILQAFRGFKSGSSIVALARAKTENAMVSNIIRVSLLPLAWYVAATGGDLLAIVWLACIGEFLGYLASMWLIKRRVGLALDRLMVPIIASLCVLLVAGIHSWAPETAAYQSWLAVAALLLFCLALATMHDLRHYILRRTLTKYVE